MVIYRFSRYFFYLFLFITTMLIYIQPYVGTVPIFNNTITAINEWYQNLDTKSNKNTDTNLSLLQEQADGFLQEQISMIQQFTNDMRFSSSINRVLFRNFSDIEYLVQEYFLMDPYFKDLMIVKQDSLLYKYENVYLSSLFSIHVPILNNMSLQVFYDNNIFQNLMLFQPDNLIVKHNTEIYTKQPLLSKFRIYLKNLPESLSNTNSGILTNIDKKDIYFTQIKEKLNSPLFFFTIQKQNFNYFNFLKIFFHLSIILIWIIIMMIDYFVSIYFKKHMDYAAYQKEFTKYNKENPYQDVEDSLSWLENFIKTETKNSTPSVPKRPKILPPKSQHDTPIVRKIVSPHSTHRNHNNE